MAKIHDWNRVYWINSRGEREYDPEGLNPDDNVLCVYENEHDDQVAYVLTDRDGQTQVVVELPEDPDEEFDQEQFVGEAVEAHLDEVEANSEHGLKDATETGREESDGEVSVTLDLTYDIPKYEVLFNGDPITDVEFEEGSRWFKDDLDEDEEQRPAEVERAQFPTRAMAREFAAAWREDFGSPEELGYFDYTAEEIMDMEYNEAQSLAKQAGVNASQSHEDIAEEISGETLELEEEEAEEEEAEAE